MSCIFKRKMLKTFLTSVFCVVSFLSADNVHAENQNVFFVQSKSILKPSIMKGAITRNDFKGFHDDFLVLHCLIKRYQPKRLLEIGTCEGVGTLIIKNAMKSGTVLSLDLPPNVPKEYHFLNARTTGAKCTLPYIQLFGDSMTYDYSNHYPIDSWFIDGEHDYVHAFHESAQALLSEPNTCFWHDTDMPEIFQAVLDTFGQREDYNIYRVEDTRITYAVKKTIEN